MASDRLEGLVKFFGKNVHAVRGVVLDIADGQLIVFVGPSGCGKMTTLNLIAGPEQPTGGEKLLVAKADSAVAWKSGDRAPFALRPNTAFLFDPETRARL